MRISTVKELINYIKENPDVCGLEQIKLDNVEYKTLTTMRVVTYVDGPYLVMTHYADKETENGVTVQMLYNTLINLRQTGSGLSGHSLFFVGDDNTYAKVKCVDGVLYLRYVEPIEEQLTSWPNERIM